MRPKSQAEQPNQAQDVFTGKHWLLITLKGQRNLHSGIHLLALKADTAAA